MSVAFENLVKSHEHLNSFIYQKHIDLIVNFNNFTEDSPAFIAWISPMYLASYKAVLQSAIDRNIVWQISKLYKVKRICNADTAIECDELIENLIKGVVNKLKDAEQLVNAGDAEKIKLLFPYYNKQWMGLFNQLPTDKRHYLEQFAAISYQLGKKMKATDMPFANIYHELVFTSIDELQCSQDLKLLIFEESKKAGKKLEKAQAKAKWSTVLSIIVIVLIIIKWVYRAMKN